MVLELGINTLLKLINVILYLIAANLILLFTFFSLRLILFLYNNRETFHSLSLPKLKENFKVLKDRLHLYFIRLQNLRFHNYIDMVNVLVLFFMIYFQIKPVYFVIYLPLYIITRVLISIVKDILLRKKEGITEFWFFIYLGLFILVIVSYIFAFSLFYSEAISFNHGYMVQGDERIKILSGIESLYYSAFTFFGMEYGGLRPKGLLTIFTIIEVFIAEILLITFIGVMASVLIDRIRLKDEQSKNDE